MTTIDQTPLAKLEREHRLFNAVLKGPTAQSKRFGFRGDIALKFQAQVADEKRPPEFSIEQVLTYAREDDPAIPILIGYLHNFAYLQQVAEVLSPLMSPSGVYIFFCNNIDLLAKYQVSIGAITFHILPLDESTVWKETLDLLGIDKNEVRKMDGGEKLDYVLDAASKLNVQFPPITLEQGLALMGPVRNRNENRPV